MIFKIDDIPDHLDTIGYITENNGFYSFGNDSIKDFIFHEFTLAELGLPTADQLLGSVLRLREKVGLNGWKTSSQEDQEYRGFSLTYNPNFLDADTSVFHQTMGSKKLTQSFGRNVNLGYHTQLKNTYYDSYSFRLVHPLIQEELGFLFDRFSCSLVRSRVAFLNRFLKQPNTLSMHQDEVPFHLFRMNIPLQTSEEYVLEINGEDDYGNKCNLVKHLEVGKVYFWNTRIPHKVDTDKLCLNPKDRIHLVLGFSPWFKYNRHLDAFEKSEFYGIPINQIIKEKLFLLNLG